MTARDVVFSPVYTLSPTSPNSEDTDCDCDDTPAKDSFVKCFFLGVLCSSLLALLLFAAVQIFSSSGDANAIATEMQDTSDFGTVEGVSLDATAKRKAGGYRGKIPEGHPDPRMIDDIKNRVASCRLIGCDGGYNHNLPCQCTKQCVQHGNCCRDYASHCGDGDDYDRDHVDHGDQRRNNRCEQIGCAGEYQPDLPCQCTSACERFNNCCDDYAARCNAPAPQPLVVTPAPQAPQPAPAVLANPDYHPLVQSLRTGSTAPVHTFYMYRAQAPASLRAYPLENVNTASLGGVLWYLHNEIIFSCDWEGHKGHRKFDITRILRFKVSVRATQPLFDRGLNFGTKCSFDSGACSGPAKKKDYDQFGYYVGCDYLGEFPHEEFQSGKKYPEAIWYSLPGSCPMNKFFDSTDQCSREQPGGHCKFGEEPTGAGDCTFTYEDAGEIDIDEMVGITPNYKDREDFCRRGCTEGNGAMNRRGNCGMHFWDDIWNEQKNRERVKRAAQMFKQKYPEMPGDEELPPPTCDFSKSKYFR